MNREILNMISSFNALQKEREKIQADLDKEIKSQKMCATQLKNLEKKLTEKMERRIDMLHKYIKQFTEELSMMNDYLVPYELNKGANYECSLFGKKYTLFMNRYFLSAEAFENRRILVEEMAKGIVEDRVDKSNPYCRDIETLIKLDKEIKKNPTLAKEKLIARDVKAKEDDIKNNIVKLKDEISEDEGFLQHCNSQLEGREPAKNTLLNRIFKRNQLKVQARAEQLSNAISLNYAKLDGYAEQLADKETLTEEAKASVEKQLEELKAHLQLIEKLESVKGKLESYNRRYVSPVQEQIEQTKIAIKSSDTMKRLHMARLETNAEDIDEMLASRYQDKALINKVLKLTKKDCTPEQWKTISLIKQHYAGYVEEKIEDLLEV